MRIYVAGLYSRNAEGKKADVLEVAENMRVGLSVCVELLTLGYSPFCPWLDFAFFLHPEGWRISMESIKAYSISWLEVCDAVILLDGWAVSPGCAEELRVAERLGKMIYYGLPDFKRIHGIP